MIERSEVQAPAFQREITLLLRTAMVVFVFTVVIGILNGIDAVTFDRKVLLAHLHVGTLGWITLSVFAASLWLFAKPDSVGWRESLPRVLAPTAAVTAVLYNVAFLTTGGYLRPVIGTVMASTILGFLVWTVAQARRMVMSVPRWGFLAALATSVTGGVLGVLLGIVLASDGDIRALPHDGEDAHPATMVVGFLVPVAMALVEWWLRPADAERPAPRAGVVQIGLLFTGGVCLMVGVLLDFVPLISLSLPFEVAAVAIFVKRNWESLRAVGWGERTASPFLAASAVAIVVNLGMLAYLLSQYADDFDAVPRHLLLALDHTMFIGVLTNALFGFLLVLTARRRTAVAPWADKVVFALVNIGIFGFWWGFVLDEALPKRLFTPLMGTGILLGLAVFFLRTLQAPAVEPEARLPVPG